MTVDATSPRRRTQNVIAETPGGSGDRVVMAGGHLDSVPGGPGIDDNGSGVATLIEVGRGDRAEAARREGPHRVLGGGGARAARLAPLRRSLDRADRGRIDAYMNLDMVGSPNPVPAVYADGDAGLAQGAPRGVQPAASSGDASASRSDHTFFQLHGIPVNGLYTGSTRPARAAAP